MEQAPYPSRTPAECPQARSSTPKAAHTAVLRRHRIARPIYDGRHAGGGGPLKFGYGAQGALCDAVPAGQRLVLARTTSAAIGALIDTGTVTRTYEESLTAFEPTDGDALVVTDTATLEALEQAGGSYTILRDYGDVFWDIRMNINDVTNNFANPSQALGSTAVSRSGNSFRTMVFLTRQDNPRLTPCRKQEPGR